MSLKFCPLIRKKCKSVDCAFWIELQQKVIATGEIVRVDGCAIAKAPDLLCENAKHQNRTQAAIEDFRNRVLEGNKQASNAIMTSNKIEMHKLKLNRGQK